MKNVIKYFLIFYTGENVKGQVYGHCAIEIKSVFPNRIEVQEYICNSFSVNIALITNIIELTYSEYSEWCKS